MTGNVLIKNRTPSSDVPYLFGLPKQKTTLLRRTSVLRSKTLAEGKFTSPEHFNFLPESKKSALLRRTSVLRSKTLVEGEFTSPEHFNFLPESKKSALLRRTSVLRSKTLAEGEFTSPEHFNFLPESKKEVTTYVVTSFLERATRLARSTAVPRHAQRATNAPLGRFLASLAPCSPLCPLESKNKGMTYVMPLFFGAGDEARTRYLHLGKVALYQMSYARGTRCTIPDIFRFVKHRF